jgi:predicted RNA-binding protein YlxR (DUF448 family)
MLEKTELLVHKEKLVLQDFKEIQDRLVRLVLKECKENRAFKESKVQQDQLVLRGNWVQQDHKEIWDLQVRKATQDQLEILVPQDRRVHQ